MISNKFILSSFVICSLIANLAIGQDFKIIKSDGNEPIIVGISSREAYQDSNFSSWFNFEYTNYQLNTNLIKNHLQNFEGKVIKIVLGTWCIDSRREVPRFVKILDFIEFPSDKILFINVDEEKKGLSDEVQGLEINFVPTFIVYENGKEIGRIIETPFMSLEEDLINIVNKTNR